MCILGKIGQFGWMAFMMTIVVFVLLVVMTSAIFNKGLDISRSNFNDKVNFWNIEIKEGDIFTSSKYADDFEVHKNEINPEKNIPSVYKQLRETYRIIKDNLYKQNNKIEGLHFSEKEIASLSQHERLLTTEKDYVRLGNTLPKLYYLPIRTQFLNEKDKEAFDKRVLSFEFRVLSLES